MKQPAIFLSHGGGPCFSIEIPGDPFGPLGTYLRGILATLPEKPRSILMISAHWMAPNVTVGSVAKPDMIYDYGGFPAHTYRIAHPAPGDPDLAHRVRQLLTNAGLEAGEDETRGFDHGVFVPMMLVDPAAAIPIATLSLRQDLDPAAHLAVGRALAPLRDEGVLILGSGNSFHNLRTFMNGRDERSAAFDGWLTEAMLDEAGREQALVDWRSAPGALAAHPDPDHLMPLMVIAGAARTDPAKVDFHGLILGKSITGFRFG